MAKMIMMKKISENGTEEIIRAPKTPTIGARVWMTVDEFGQRHAILEIDNDQDAVEALAGGMEAVAREFGVPPMDLFRAVKTAVRRDLELERKTCNAGISIRQKMGWGI